MTPETLSNLITIIKTLPVCSEENDIAKTLLKLAADSIALDALTNSPCSKTLMRNSRSVKPESNGDNEKTNGILTFTKKELSAMPKFFQNYFIYDNVIIKYRYYKGLFQVRYQKNGVRIEVASKDFEKMKMKFIKRLCQQETKMQESPKSEKTNSLFSDFSAEWLKIKAETTKPSTYKEYSRLVEKNLNVQFGNFLVSDITRKMIQDYLFQYTNAGKHRTAENLHLLLDNIFDIAVEDCGIKSPTKKITLPYYKRKKGSAFTKAEERILVNYCLAHPESTVSDALLVLLFFGLRQSELKTLRIIDGKYLACETSKERLGRDVVIRKIPFTPVAQKVIPHINFEKAKNAKHSSISSALYKLFPHHHPHELRYTFITRCKECGVNPEVVMLWDGHKKDKDVRASAVDIGYTDYSEEYILSEAQKVNYDY